MTDAAVATLQARGEAAPWDLLLAEILLALDRTGLLRRYVIARGREADGTATEAGSEDASADDPGGSPDSRDEAPPTAMDGGLVQRLLDLIQVELRRPSQRRLAEIAPGRWWLSDRAELDAASPPLADRLEWATYSLLSTGGPLSAPAFRDRISNLFRGPDLPDPAMVAACLASYRSAASAPERLETGDSLAVRTHEHAELIGLLAETGHRLGLQVWISVRAQGRRYGDRLLGDLLERAERTAYLGGIAPGRTEALEDVDVAWYARGRVTFLFEVEWTAMLAEPLLGRHAELPADDRVVRFLVVPPERAALIGTKLDASPVLRSIVETQNWHVIKWNHVRTFAALERPSLDDLEPFIGLDPAIERASEQLPLFEADAARPSPERASFDDPTGPVRAPTNPESQSVRVARPGDASAGR